MSSEIQNALLNLAVAASSLGLSWLIGQRVLAYWADRQKRKELELSLASEFYRYYGDFRAVWKLWNETLKEFGSDRAELLAHKGRLLEQATVAEGGIEAALLKVCSERILCPDEQSDLGNLRQAFQVLQERIRANVALTYGASEDPDYLEFKRLATKFGVMLASRGPSKRPTAEQAYFAFREVTSNRYEHRWKRAGNPDGSG